MRIWGKLFHHNRMIRDFVVTNDDPAQSRTQKIVQALQDVCYEFDLSVPIWLQSNIQDVKRLSRTRFRQENFIDGIDFDFLDFQIIEEDS